MSDNTDNLLRDLSDKLSADERFLSYKEIHQLCRLQQAEIERLRQLNEDKHRHLEAYRKAASDDKAENERLRALCEDLVGEEVLSQNGTYETEMRKQQAEIELLLKQRNIAADNCVEARQVARIFLTAAETLDRAAEIQRYPWLEDSTDATRTQDNRA